MDNTAFIGIFQSSGGFDVVLQTLADHTIFVGKGWKPHEAQAVLLDLGKHVPDTARGVHIGVLEVAQRLVSSGTSRKERLAVFKGAQLAMAQRAADSGLNSEMLQDFSQASGQFAGPIGARFREAQNLKRELARSLKELKNKNTFPSYFWAKLHQNLMVALASGDATHGRPTEEGPTASV